jgi:6,7-dimethyl-8-ribityllumazine synthase
MTSSDLTLLPADAKERTAARVGTALDGAASSHPARLRVGFACAEFNGGITDRLLSAALDALEESGCDLGEVTVAWVPGAFELPLVAQELATSGSVDAVICLGAVIRGDTGHYDFVAGECAAGLQRVQLATGKPVVFGVLTTDTVEQALVRSEDDGDNKGREAAHTAIETVTVLAAVASAGSGSRVGFGGGR